MSDLDRWDDVEFIHHAININDGNHDMSTKDLEEYIGVMGKRLKASREAEIIARRKANVRRREVVRVNKAMERKEQMMRLSFPDTCKMISDNLGMGTLLSNLMLLDSNDKLLLLKGDDPWYTDYKNILRFIETYK